MIPNIERRLDLMLKHSRQRDAILANLRSRYDHPNADMIFASIKEEIPNISLGTIYRNLALLVEMGEILKIGPSDDGKERYDGHTHPHSHFFCEACGGIYDIGEIFDARNLEESLHIRIYEASTTLKGICHGCLHSQNQKQF